MLILCLRNAFALHMRQPSAAIQWCVVRVFNFISSTLYTFTAPERVGKLSALWLFSPTCYIDTAHTVFEWRECTLGMFEVYHFTYSHSLTRPLRASEPWALWAPFTAPNYNACTLCLLRAFPFRTVFGLWPSPSFRSASTAFLFATQSDPISWSELHFVHAQFVFLFQSFSVINLIECWILQYIFFSMVLRFSLVHVNYKWWYLLQLFICSNLSDVISLSYLSMSLSLFLFYTRTFVPLLVPFLASFLSTFLNCVNSFQLFRMFLICVFRQLLALNAINIGLCVREWSGGKWHCSFGDRIWCR